MACRSGLCHGISFSTRSAVSLTVPRVARSAAGPSTLRAGQLNPRLKHVVCRAVASGSTEAEAAYSNVSGGESHEDRMQELVVFLRQELPELFRTGVRFQDACSDLYRCIVVSVIFVGVVDAAVLPTCLKDQRRRARHSVR